VGILLRPGFSSIGLWDGNVSDGRNTLNYLGRESQSTLEPTTTEK